MLSNAGVVAGRFNRVSGENAHALGSFASVDHDDAIVISGLNQPDCASSGVGTVRICTQDANGVFINSLNIVDELDAVKLQAQTNQLDVASAEALVSALSQNLSNALARIAVLEQNISAAFNALGSINEACFQNGRRLGQEIPCFAAAGPEQINLALILPLSIGAALAVLLALWLSRRVKTLEVSRPRATKSDYSYLFRSWGRTTRSSDVMPPPKHKPPESGELRPPTPPPAPHRQRHGKRGSSERRTWFPRSFHSIFLRSSLDDKQRDSFEEKSEESHERFARKSESSQEEEMLDDEREAIF